MNVIIGVLVAIIGLLILFICGAAAVAFLRAMSLHSGGAKRFLQRDLKRKDEENSE